MLSGRLLPAHPQPQVDELFSSWLVRIAKANGQKLHTFCRQVLGEVSIWNRDIDKSVTSQTLVALARKSGTNIRLAKQTSLAAFEGTLYEVHNPRGMTPWILPIGVYHRVRRRKGLQFCPQCLAGDVDPYFRRAWRLALYTVCPQHGCKLLDSCPKCDAAVMFHRRDFFDKENPDFEPLTNCFACGFDLTSSPISVADTAVVDFVRLSHQILQRGWIELPQLGCVYSHLYFNGIRHLMKLVAIDKKCSERFKSINISISHYKETPGRGIEYLDIEVRYEAMRIVADLLRDWPVTFVDACRRANLHKSYLMKDFEAAPWWYAEPVHWYLSRMSYQTNEQEIANVLLWMKRNNMPINARRVSRMLGESDCKLAAKILHHE